MSHEETKYYISEEDLWEFITNNHILLEQETVEKAAVDLDDLEHEDIVTPEKPKSLTGFRLVWPSEQEPYVTQWYGVNRFLYERWGLPGHEGLDIRAFTGSKVFAAAAGVVTKVVRTVRNKQPYGKHIFINHNYAGQTYRTIYAHLQEIVIEETAQVLPGMLIGYANNTGNSSGPHLHFGMKRIGVGKDSFMPNDYINPVPYFDDLFPGVGWRVVVGGNLRMSALLKSKIMTYVEPGTIVDAIDFYDDWWKISLPDYQEGFFWNPGYKLQPLVVTG